MTLNNTLCALKFLIISQRLLMYCPGLFNDQDLGKLTSFQAIFNNWKEIIDKRIPNLQDKYRCEYFGKVIRHYASNLNLQVETSSEFK